MLGSSLCRPSSASCFSSAPYELTLIGATTENPSFEVNAALLSRSAIAASTHLVLFIALYQPIESLRSNNQRQRMLTTALIFIILFRPPGHVHDTAFNIPFGRTSCFGSTPARSTSTRGPLKSDALSASTADTFFIVSGPCTVQCSPTHEIIGSKPAPSVVWRSQPRME